MKFSITGQKKVIVSEKWSVLFNIQLFRKFKLFFLLCVAEVTVWAGLTVLVDCT
jgi:hypothetical protein